MTLKHDRPSMNCNNAGECDSETSFLPSMTAKYRKGEAKDEVVIRRWCGSPTVERDQTSVVERQDLRTGVRCQKSVAKIDAE